MKQLITNKIVLSLSAATLLSICLFFGAKLFNNPETTTLLFSIPTVDFDTSMKKDLHQSILTNQLFEHWYAQLKSLYNKHNPAQLTFDTMPRIPKKIHLIWLGSKDHQLPEKFTQYKQSWLTYHPDWEYKLWTEKDVDSFPFFNKKLFDQEKNYGAKSDIWRYEILYHHGGLYVDVDFECMGPCDAFNHMYDLYTGIQPLDTNSVQLGIGLIGSKPHHPFLKVCIEQLRHNTHIGQIILKTGPIHFTRCFISTINTFDTIDIAFPASYFYPEGYTQKNLPRSVWLKPESFAAHHWAGSWLSQNAFEPT